MEQGLSLVVSANAGQRLLIGRLAAVVGFQLDKSDHGAIGGLQSNLAAVTLLAAAHRAGHAVDGLVLEIDLGTDNYEQENTLHLLANEERMLEEISAALDRLDSGNFGTCEECKLEIGKPRLKELPYTRWCVECARKQDRSSSTRTWLADSPPTLCTRIS